MRRKLLEDLFDVNFHSIGYETVVTEYGSQWLKVCQLLNEVLLHPGFLQRQVSD